MRSTRPMFVQIIVRLFCNIAVSVIGFALMYLGSIVLYRLGSTYPDLFWLIFWQGILYPYITLDRALQTVFLYAFWMPSWLFASGTVGAIWKTVDLKGVQGFESLAIRIDMIKD